MSSNRYLNYREKNMGIMRGLKKTERKVCDALEQLEQLETSDSGPLEIYSLRALSAISNLIEDANLNAGALADLTLAVFRVGKETGKDTFKKHITNL